MLLVIRFMNEEQAGRWARHVATQQGVRVHGCVPYTFSHPADKPNPDRNTKNKY